MVALPRTDIDIVAALRVQLDEADARNAKLCRENVELQRQVDDLQRLLIGTAEDLVEEKRTTDRGDSFWSQVAHVANQRTAKVQLRLTTVERWLLEQGQEATRLQTALVAEREETAQVSRLLDASEDRVAQLEAHIARLGDTIVSREVD